MYLKTTTFWKNFTHWNKSHNNFVSNGNKARIYLLWFLINMINDSKHFCFFNPFVVSAMQILEIIPLTACFFSLILTVFWFLPQAETVEFMERNWLPFLKCVHWFNVLWGRSTPPCLITYMALTFFPSSFAIELALPRLSINPLHFPFLLILYDQKLQPLPCRQRINAFIEKRDDWFLNKWINSKKKKLFSI